MLPYRLISRSLSLLLSSSYRRLSSSRPFHLKRETSIGENFFRRQQLNLTISDASWATTVEKLFNLWKFANLFLSANGGASPQLKLDRNVEFTLTSRSSQKNAINSCCTKCIKCKSAKNANNIKIEETRDTWASSATSTSHFYEQKWKEQKKINCEEKNIK